MEARTKTVQGKSKNKRARNADESESQSEDDYRLRLSAYEKQRPPIPIITDDTQVTLPLKVLSEEFTCPVCRNILQQTMVTVECMHRFCYACIREALFKGNKECPACRRECHSMRNLRPDTRFDEIIRMIYPSLGSSETEDATELDSIIARSTFNLRKMYEEGIKRQEMVRKGRGVKRSTTVGAADCANGLARSPRISPDGHDDYEIESENGTCGESNTESDGVRSETSVSDAPSPEPASIQTLSGQDQPPWTIEVTAIAHPCDKRLPLGEVLRLRTENECTVGHLSMVLREYYAAQSDQFRDLTSDDFVVTLSRPIHGKPLDKHITVGEARDKAETGGVLLLYHALKS
ncbi:uncharacterized protein SPPG_08072 [Spizellomyces punctatus DAOM BR117]|uniref:RING-type E3 ubiquitin transferase n=1 Tax=Spizellomyces punctatus (strain DAOM BR117) TaxID=645134 RepID=A0A0L0H5I7_SPIPD|nr:uncharacterized protein SPPG_08072 [Spizellomyces punctatus DAOM BR117]KNC96482.1 hypothetical protein SPPG_08072 [Spizellomyces punctatus DAOM BR117]|eukprot:XP_016604522.1 hypothetical protein SPPG_08072 [Spizellomyces punctatus DAOM BR117]